MSIMAWRIGMVRRMGRMIVRMRMISMGRMRNCGRVSPPLLATGNR